MKRVLFTLLCTLSAFAQWPSNPSQNLLICDHNGEQALPKIAALSEGGCYVAWQDLSSGNYDIYLQRLDADGVPQWANPCGILVSDHQQDTWLTDWDIAVDIADNCILAINDIRNGADRDITVYSIGPQQEFLWGPDGIALSNNDGFEPDPRILPMENGDVVFAWQEEDSIHIRKLDSEGHDAFENSATITFTQANGVSIPRVAALDNNGFALSYLAQQGTQFSSPRYLYVRAYNADGSNRWVEQGIEIMNQSGIGIQMRPDLVSDGAGGVYVYWYDARGNVHHCYVQHIENDGVAHWTANGVSVDASASELQMSPSAVNTGAGVVIFYQSSNTNQSQGGVQAQYLNTSGQAQWNANGVVIAPLAAEPCFNVKAYVQNGNYAVFYSQYAPGSQINTLLRASQLGEAGQSTWTPAIKELCTVVSEKGRPYTCINPLNQIIATWPDARDGDMDLYVQNINSSGSLGPLVDLPPSISITSPEDNDTTDVGTVTLVFDVDNFNLDPDNGDGYVLVIVNGSFTDTLSSEEPITVDFLFGSNQIFVYLVDREYHSLDPVVSDFVTVHYTPLWPRITITSPPLDTLTFENVLIHFEVENFVVSDSLGDGHIRVQNVRDFGMVMDTVEFEHYSLDPIDAQLGFPALNFIRLDLVDNMGNLLDPEAFIQTWIHGGEIISADPTPELTPTDFSISSAYPNPFNSTLSIQYDVPTPAHVTLNVYDLTGRQVATLVNSVLPSGSHSTSWQADNFPSGLYFLNLRSGSHSESRKIVLLK